MKILTFTNQKGGTGKTTSALSVGAGLSRKGYKVLIVDLDPQEKAFIDNYRQLDPEGKRDVFNMLRYLAQVDLEEDTEDINQDD